MRLGRRLVSRGTQYNDKAPAGFVFQCDIGPVAFDTLLVIPFFGPTNCNKMRAGARFFMQCVS